MAPRGRHLVSNRTMTNPRKKVWARRADSLAILAGGIATADLLLAFSLVTGGYLPHGITVIRTRITWAFERTTAPGVLDDFYVGVGVADRSADAPDLDPETEIHRDWAYWSRNFVASGSNVDADLVTGEIDVQAMRKLDEIGQTWTLAVTMGPAALAGIFNYGCSTLMLMP